MKNFLQTQINASSDITYGHLLIAVTIGAALLSFIAYNVIKTEKKYKHGTNYNA